MNVNTKAATQLFNRPDDETYSDMDSFVKFLDQRNEVTEEHQIEEMGVEPTENGITLNAVTKDLQVFTDQEMTEWSFRHVCRLAEAPAFYINRLDSDLAARCLNAGLGERFENGNGVVMNRTGTIARAFYTTKYERVSDAQVAHRVNDLATPLGYLPAGEIAGKRGGLPPVRPGASGLYASDRDMFMFMANEQTPFTVDGDDYYRCFIIWNSEVWGKTIGFMSCLYRFICGNHNIWGARDEIEYSAKHVGEPVKVLDRLDYVLRHFDEYREEQQAVDTTRIQASKYQEFADTRERVQERLATYMKKKEAKSVLPFLNDERAFPERPTSAFNVSNAVTLYSQTLPFSEKRMDMDLVAGKILTDVVGF